MGFSPWGPHLIPRLIALSIALALYAQTAFAEQTSISIPNIGRVTLDFQPSSNSAGNFSSIRIKSAGKTVLFTPKNPVANIPVDQKEKLFRGLWESPSGLQIDSSRLFFRGEYTSDSHRHTLLFFISEGYASEAPPLFVVGFTYMGEPYKVLELDEFDITAFQPVDDGTALIIGKPTLSEVMAGDGGSGSKAPYATTYDPYAVYTVHAEGPATYSLSSSRLYNERHYVWAGPRSREDYAVLYNLPGHPKRVGAPASRVDALLSSAKAPKTR